MTRERVIPAGLLDLGMTGAFIKHLDERTVKEIDR
jgi:hypothetical protein